MKYLLHTPEGVRDIYMDEYAKKLGVQEKIHQVLHSYGYMDIQTPTFEYSDVFRDEIGTAPSKVLYKFFDREGNTMVLRPDITPQISRVAATLLHDEDFPARICYSGSTYINHLNYQGRPRETTQMGAELLGMDSIMADAEIIALAIQSLLKSGLQEFQVNIGHVGFIDSLISFSGLTDGAKDQLIRLIRNRNYFAITELLLAEGASPMITATFDRLYDLVGGPEVLEAARNIAPDRQASMSLDRLEEIYKLLSIYGLEKYITFDLSMRSGFGYYTGILFRAYTYGTGDAIIKGGRYNELVEKFGRKVSAIGCAIMVDDLMQALHRQNISVETASNKLMIIYDAESSKEALSYAIKAREEGHFVELIEEDSKKAPAYYDSLAKSKQISEVITFAKGGLK